MFRQTRKRFNARIMRLIRGNQGTTSTEYAVILGVIIIGVLLSVTKLGEGVSNTVVSVDSAIASATGGGGGGDDDGGDDD